MLCFLNANAQQSISGSVIDQQSGEAVPGATILVKGTNKGTTTDFDGLFTLPNISIGDIIEVTYVGFKTQERILENLNQLTFF